MSLSTLDIVVIALYFALVFIVAIWVTIKDKRKEGDRDSAGYFLAGKNMGWFVIGASLFASNIGSEHLVGLAGAGARGDFVNAQFEILAALILLVLGWVFVPFYLKSGVFTMPEFLEKRFSRSSRNYLSVISILSYVLTKISVTIFAGALVFEVMLGIEFWLGAIIVVVATGAYTVFGGLRAVVYTDLMQMFVLIGGAIAVTYFGLSEMGGWHEVKDAIATNAGNKSETYLSLWRSIEDADFPWTGIVFGAPILGVWYWCTDQFIVQRVLSAKDLSNARKGTIFAGFMKLLPLFLFVIPGVIAYALYTKDNSLMATADGSIDFDTALPSMVMTFLPSGFKGLVAAGLLAALMSSLSSVFNSCSTLFTIDFYRTWKPKAAERELVIVGQVATVILVIIGLAWIPLMRTMMEGNGLFKYIQSIQAYISPPIAAVFLFGLFFPRLNAKGAIASLWTGFVLGVGRLVMEFLTAKNEAGKAYLELSETSFLYELVNINFLHFAILLFSICTFVLVLASLTAEAPSKVSLANVTFKKFKMGNDPGLKTDMALTITLVVLVCVLWIVFSPYGIA